MKIQGNIKNLKKFVKSQGKEIDNLLNLLTNNYYSDLIKYQEDLLINICKDHDLPYEDLHNKYIKTFKKNLKKKNLNLIENSDSDSENEDDIESIIKNTNNLENNKPEHNILEKVVINEKTCYIENKEGGSIYDSDVIKIGEVKSGDYILYE
jgi:hypothetical protein